MSSRIIWLGAISLIIVAWLLYLVAPGAAVLVVILGLVAIVVIGDRLEERERMAEVEAKRERLREAARRLP